MNIEEFGFNLQRLVAGFSGSLVHVMIFRRIDPFALIGSILTGTLTANFLGPAFGHYTSALLGDGGSAFVVGLTAMIICQGVVQIVEARVKQMRNQPPSGDAP